MTTERPLRGRKEGKRVKTFYGYDVYRGRSRIKTALTVIILILLVVLILAVAAFFLIQPYITYDDQGKAHVEFPFFQTQPTPTPEPIATPDIVVVTPAPTPEPTPEPGPVVAALPLSALTDGTAADLAQQAGATAVLFDMKTQEGDLAYVSGQEMARHTGVSASDPALNEAIQAFNQGELYTIARVSCFKDNIVPYTYGPTCGFRVGGGNWRDASGSRWLSPATQGAQDYVAGICAELAQLGFDELLLDYGTFPTQGRMNSIVRGDAYQDDSAFKALALADFYARVREALTDYPDVKVSLMVEPGFLTGDSEDLSGLTAQLVEEYIDLLYLPLPGEGQDYTAVLEAAGLPENRLVYIGGDGSQGNAGRLLDLAE